MRRRIAISYFALIGALAVSAPPASAGIPFAPFSTCTVTVTQTFARTQCINNFTPDVARLCPSQATQTFDSVRIEMVVRDALEAVVPNATIIPYETSGVVNLADGGFTTATTDSNGRASINIDRASGCGRVGVCADGVLLCEISVRSPDNAFSGGGPGSCDLPMVTTSWVNASDKLNQTCGFNSKFGLVTPGVNDCWDMTCDNIVSASDVTGILLKGGYNQHTAHGSVLGPKNTCP